MYKQSAMAHAALCALSLLIAACSSSDPKPMEKAAKAAKATALSSASYAEVSNARQKVKWNGVYQGIFPCSGCEGIATMLKINPDMSFELRTRELGREEMDKKSTGKFVWLSDNSHIQLQGTETKRIFRVGDGFIELMGNNGKPVAAANRKNFVLEKTD